MQVLKSPADVTESVYEAILDAICDGSLEPGQRLVEGELALRLGVSRLPVHQALKQLHREGFLFEAGRRGLSVANFHDFVYQFAGNRLISAAAHTNWHHVRRSILMLAKRPIRLGPFWDEHDAILLSVIDGDAAAAGQLARQHAINSGQVLSRA